MRYIMQQYPYSIASQCNIEIEIMILTHHQIVLLVVQIFVVCLYLPFLIQVNCR